MKWQELMPLHNTFFANQLLPEATQTSINCGKSGTIRAQFGGVMTTSFVAYQFLEVHFVQWQPGIDIFILSRNQPAGLPSIIR
jgi:hypothetical protein